MERELVVKYKEKYVEVNQLSDRLDKAKEELEKLKTGILELMEAEGKDRTATYEGVGFVSRMKPQLYANCNEENKPRLFEILRAEGRDDLIKEVVNPRSLSSYVSELLENGRPVPECIGYVLKPSLRLYSKE